VDRNQFDVFTKSLGEATSRRGLVRGLAGGGIAAALAGRFEAIGVEARQKRAKKPKKKVQARCRPNCSERSCGNDGCGGSCGVCGSNQVCHGGTCCVPESRGDTCAGRCGTWENNCGQPVTCNACAAGQQCLGNGSCAIVCTTNNDCTGSCNGCSNPSVEGEHHCIVGPLIPTVTCTTTDDCPPGSHCQNIGVPVCISLCA
jgi:hypothetical protein